MQSSLIQDLFLWLSMCSGILLSTHTTHLLTLELDACRAAFGVWYVLYVFDSLYCACAE